MYLKHNLVNDGNVSWIFVKYKIYDPHVCQNELTGRSHTASYLAQSKPESSRCELSGDKVSGNGK